jgi:tRNA U34 2-thiouridine synthase MnmA/TrmU
MVTGAESNTVDRSGIKAIGLISGGLDSTLAAKLLLDQGLTVIGLNYSTGFCMNNFRRALDRPEQASHRVRNEALRAGSDLAMPLEIIDVADEYLEKVVMNPKHGYGSQMNPCIDCRIFMLGKAKSYMKEFGGQFIFTGEVVAQRPMSQHRPTLRMIEKEADLDGYLLRPLSAKVLPETIPEKRGWVDRERLLGIHGRGRKVQIAMARAAAIEEYPQPSGGCCHLTDETFGRRFRDRLQFLNGGAIRTEDLVLLKVGRHFRLSDRCKAILGRDEYENHFLEPFRNRFWSVEAIDAGSPITILEGHVDPETVDLAASITARYSSRRGQEQVEVQCRSDRGEDRMVSVPPMAEAELERYRI